MSSVWLPCGDYHQNYVEDQGWWQSKLIKGKMILLLAIVFIGIPLTDFPPVLITARHYG